MLMARDGNRSAMLAVPLGCFTPSQTRQPRRHSPKTLRWPPSLQTHAHWLPSIVLPCYRRPRAWPRHTRRPLLQVRRPHQAQTTRSISILLPLSGTQRLETSWSSMDGEKALSTGRSRSRSRRTFSSWRHHGSEITMWVFLCPFRRSCVRSPIHISTQMALDPTEVNYNLIALSEVQQ